MTLARALPPLAMLERARLLAPLAGITRVADATGYDRIGLPIFQAVRPQGRFFSVSQGKGRSRTAARLSAIMEGVECHAAETAAAAARRAPTAAELACWFPRLRQPTSADRSIGWIAGADLLTGRAVEVPLALVSLDTTMPQDVPVVATTTGLAAGALPVEAEVVGLAEVLERAVADRFWRLPPRERRALEVAVDAVPGRTMAWCRQLLARAGMEARLWDLTPLAGTALFMALLLDARRTGPMLPPALGQACRFDGPAAAFAAVAEAAQARATLMAGARDDIASGAYRDGEMHLASLLVMLLSTTASREPPRPWPAPPADWLAARDRLIGLLAAAGADRVAALDLTPTAMAGLVHVARIVAPALPDGGQRP